MKRIILIVLVALAFPAMAQADPFSYEMEQDYAFAELWWEQGAPPCEEVEKISFTYGTLPGQFGVGEAWGEASTTHGVVQHKCRIQISQGLTICQTYAVMIHEFGHLLGYHHSTDPNNIMYPVIEAQLVCEEPKPYVGIITFPRKHQFRHRTTLRASRVKS